MGRFLFKYYILCIQIESKFRKELESANITIESPTFKTDEGPMNVATNFFVSDLLEKLSDNY